MAAMTSAVPFAVVALLLLGCLPQDRAQAPPDPVAAFWPFSALARPTGEAPSEAVLRELEALLSQLPAGGGEAHPYGGLASLRDEALARVRGEINALSDAVSSPEGKRMVDALLGGEWDAARAMQQASQFRESMARYREGLEALLEESTPGQDPDRAPGRRQLIQGGGVVFPWWFSWTYDPPPYTFALLYFLGPTFYWATFPFLFASLFLNASGLALFL